MKKFISLFLVMTIIIANINMPISYALSNNSNEVKVENNTISQTDEEKTDELTGQDDSSEAINLNNNEGESSNANKLDSTDDTDTIDDQKVLNETSNVNDNSSTYSNQAITVSDNNISRQFSNLNSAMSSIKNNTFSGDTVTIKFNENYTFTDQDATSMAYTFNNNRLIFSTLR